MTTLEELRVQFKLAFLDYTRWLLGYALPNLTPEKVAKNLEAELSGTGTINEGIFRRSITRLEWLISHATEYLAEYEAGQLVL